MKPRTIELILNSLLVVLSIFAALTSHIFFTLSLFTSAILLSFYYVLWYGNEVAGPNAIVNILIRITLSIYPIAYVITYVNPDKGLIVGFVFLLLSILLSVIKLVKGITDKYELLRLYVLYGLLTFADVPFR